MEYVYILKTEDWKSSYYIGVTSDVQRRLKEHNSGMNPSTKGARWKVVYVEGYLERSFALKRELKLKKDRRVWNYLKRRIEESLK